jgi:RNA polymerase sigma-70 factor (ECF subfamily)
MMPQTAPIELTIPALFEGYAQRLYRYAFSLMHEAAEADDVVQETFLRTHHRLDSLRDPTALTPWLYRIATHICLDRLRQRTRRAPLEIDADPTDVTEVDSDSPSLQQIVEQNEMSDCVQRYLDSLSDSYRAVILLHDLHELTGPEMAELLGVSLATVKIRLHRARRKLQAQLEVGCAFSHDKRDVLVCEPKP